MSSSEATGSTSAEPSVDLPSSYESESSSIHEDDIIVEPLPQQEKEDSSSHSAPEMELRESNLLNKSLEDPLTFESFVSLVVNIHENFGTHWTDVGGASDYPLWPYF